MSKSTNRLLVTVAAAAATGALCAQPAREAASTDAEGQLRRQISELQTAGGPTPAGLVDPLRALAVLYREDDDHVKAIAALEEARHVTRVHRGLTSADEALLLRQQIRSEKALELHERVWNLEQTMVTIARQHHDDVRMMPVFRELAEDRSDALEEYLAGGFPPEIELGCYYISVVRRYDDTRGKVHPPRDSHPTGCLSGSKRVVIGAFRSEILMYYADAIEVLVRNGDYSSQELRDLEAQALGVAPYNAFAFSPCSGPLDELLALPLLGDCLQPVMHVGDTVIPNIGWASLFRLIAYEFRSRAPAAARANAIAELADWHLWAGRRFEERALEIYERAYRELEHADDMRSSAAQIFAPPIPVALPTLERNPLAAAAPASSRYIDVAFAVTKYGKPERIEILDTSRDATRAEERDLKRLIEGMTFRPRVVDGEIAASAPVVVRYALDR
jgi:hypothetical protein